MRQRKIQIGLSGTGLDVEGYVDLMVLEAAEREIDKIPIVLLRSL